MLSALAQHGSCQGFVSATDFSISDYNCKGSDDFNSDVVSYLFWDGSNVEVFVYEWMIENECDFTYALVDDDQRKYEA